MLSLKANGEVFYDSEQVNIKLCFPETHPEKYISLVNSAGDEVHFIEDLKDYSDKEKNIVKSILDQSTRKMMVLDVLNIEEEIELRVFHVLTDSGKTIFYTKLEDWPHHMKDGSYLIRDIHGDDYSISTDKLSQKARNLIGPLLF